MASSYDQYKISTDKFVSFIHLLASTDNVIKNVPNTLAGLVAKVNHLVASSPVRLAELLQSKFTISDFENALRNGEKAISLRKRVYLSFMKSTITNVDQKLKNAQHYHCIKVLSECHKNLKGWLDSYLITMDMKRFDINNTSPSNGNRHFDGLDIGMDDSNDESEDNSFRAMAATYAINDQQQDQIYGKSIEKIDEAFDKFKVEVLSLVGDIMRICDRVTDIWRKLRRREVDILTPVVVTIAAIDAVNAMESEFQLRYPQVETSFDFFVSALRDHVTEDDENELRQRYAAFGQLLTIRFCLDSFCSSAYDHKIPMKDRTALVSRKSYFGKPYVEYHDGKHNFDAKKLTPLFFDEIATLYNYCVGHAHTKDNQPICEDRPACQTFMTHLNDTFRTGKAKLISNFVLFCWLTSHNELADSDVLYKCKTVYLYRYNERNAMNSYLPSNWRDSDNDVIKNCNETLNVNYGLEFIHYHQNSFHHKYYGLLHNNPLLAGSSLLDTLLRKQQSCFKQVQLVSGYYRAVAHLYHGLKQEGYLTEPIEAMEEYMQLFQERLFMSSELPRQGDYLSQYLSASQVSNELIQATAKGLSKPSTSNTSGKTQATRYKNMDLDLSEMSIVYNAVVNKDYPSVVKQAGKDNVTWEGLLQTLALECQEETCGDRVLTIDLIKYFSGYFYEFFDAIIKHPSIKLESTHRMDESQVPMIYFSAIESTVMMNSMNLLDIGSTQRDNNIHELLQAITGVFKETFKSEEDRHDQRMFLFSKNVNTIYVGLFGEIITNEKNFLKQFSDLDCNETFTHILNILEENNESGKDFDLYLVAFVRGLVKCNPACSKYVDFMEGNLPTIIDHVFAGRFDENHYTIREDLIEWLVAMGGIRYCHDHYIKSVCNFATPTLSHLQVLAKLPWPSTPIGATVIDTTRASLLVPATCILAESQGLDLQYQCKTDGNTAMHYCVANNNHELFQLMIDYGAASHCHIRNKQGKTVLQMTNNQSFINEFSKKITSLNSQAQRLDENTRRNPLGRTAMFTADSQLRAEQLTSLLDESIIERVSNQHGKLKQVKTSTKKCSDSSQLSKEELARRDQLAKKAEQELLAMLEVETQKMNANNNKNKKKKGKK